MVYAYIWRISTRVRGATYILEPFNKRLILPILILVRWAFQSYFIGDDYTEWLWTRTTVWGDRETHTSLSRGVLNMIQRFSTYESYDWYGPRPASCITCNTVLPIRFAFWFKNNDFLAKGLIRSLPIYLWDDTYLAWIDLIITVKPNNSLSLYFIIGYLENLLW